MGLMSDMVWFHCCTSAVVYHGFHFTAGVKSQFRMHVWPVKRITGGVLDVLLECCPLCQSNADRIVVHSSESVRSSLLVYRDYCYYYYHNFVCHRT